PKRFREASINSADNIIYYYKWYMMKKSKPEIPVTGSSDSNMRVVHSILIKNMTWYQNTIICQSIKIIKFGQSNMYIRHETILFLTANMSSPNNHSFKINCLRFLQQFLKRVSLPEVIIKLKCNILPAC